MATNGMYLFEVIRWGNDSDNIYSGGPNGPDTCFLVRAETKEQAAGLVDAELATWPMKRVENWASAIYLLGSDEGTEQLPRILRDPYIHHAYNYGWRGWYRKNQDAPWEEKIASTKNRHPRRSDR